MYLKYKNMTRFHHDGGARIGRGLSRTHPVVALRCVAPKLGSSVCQWCVPRVFIPPPLCTALAGVPLRRKQLVLG